ncbi:MAG: hypothetical protein KF870_07390 [Leadbetterella sp.]|nr:hypothetical protein [Leadbetterella sp.]
MKKQSQNKTHSALNQVAETLIAAGLFQASTADIQKAMTTIRTLQKVLSDQEANR